MSLFGIQKKWKNSIIKSNFSKTKGLQLLILSIVFTSCSPKNKSAYQDYESDVYQTSYAGDNLKLLTNDEVKTTSADVKKVSLELLPDKEFQKYYGFGASFTESSAWNLATIPVESRKEVLTKLFSPTEGAGFTLTRTHINSSDYSNTHYTYVEEGDEDLSTFSINEDLKGFSGDENEQVNGIELVDPKYDLIPMILEASSIPGANFKIIASPWSPPSWMKTGETAEMTNGTLFPKYYGLWAEYMSKYVTAYKEQGITLWGLTPQNEPLHAKDAQWDSNGFTPEQGRDFLRDHLGPQLVKDGHLNLDDLESGLRVLIYDHNKSTMNEYVAATYNDPEASKYAWGTAFHWYTNSELKENNWYADELTELQKTWPNKGMIHSESSIDIDAKDPIGQYWRASTDYAGTFVPFETYAYDIITDLNHGTQGYVEWCSILSHKGQPNPYNNFNSAPVLINPTTDEVIYTPLYYLLSHFSKFIRPDAHRIGINGDKVEGLIYTAAKNTDGSIAVVVYNNNDVAHEISLKLETKNFTVQIAPKALQTILLSNK
ncbi:glycoside hydrolase family 30 protein [Winogradskyella undariae]|uniref:glycoside hydrolase family 30 protein n=1 Tax=Winogradskyella undariae TaxID=1285465 RepID=UPI0015CD140F|nr:glycoside hydrolase family 30 protein [Winogradskyella undariae]QNK78359.1 glycoside hydrolase family 30 protein [Winogradskyella sp. PAMC22761]